MAGVLNSDKTFRMKIEVFILPKGGEVRMAPSAPSVVRAPVADKMLAKERPTSASKIPWKLMALSLLLVGIFIVCGMASYSAYSAISAMDELTVRRSSQPAVQKQNAESSGRPADDKSRVLGFDNSQLLHRGDVVVVRQKKGANVGKVTVAANSAAVLKRDGNVEALYVLGEGRYLVTSEGQTRIVRGNEILATVASAAGNK